MQTAHVPEKEEFRQYLEKSGVIDSLTKVLVSLYEEADKPTDALDYIKKHLSNLVGVDIDGLKKENEDLKAKVAQQAATISELEKKLNPEAAAPSSSQPAATVPAPAPAPAPATAQSEKEPKTEPKAN